ncbi:MAG TPA: response regulator [Spirochaetota bacterium]|nr:response regulator [Spirochaetota bacterium]
MENTIFYIEDDDNARDDLSHFLKEMGYNIVEFKNAKSFFAEFNHKSYQNADLIITDIIMEEMTGLDLINELSKNGLIDNLPILFVSALVDEKDIIKAYNSSNKSLIVDYLTKPINLEILLIKIQNLITLKHSYNSLKTANEEILRINIELENLLDDKNSINEYLKNRIVKILHNKNSHFDKQIETMKSILPGIATNDIALIKFVLKVIEKSQSVIEHMIIGAASEEEEIFKILPKTIEPLKTAVVDIELIINRLIDIGIIEREKIESSNIKKTSFYEIVSMMYEDGDFSEELFNEFVDDSKFNFKGGDIELF